VIDAAGAIYVIGGFTSMPGVRISDVWVSTDGGADRTRVGARGDSRSTLGVPRGTKGYWQGTKVYVPLGYWRYSRGTEGYFRGSRGVSRGT
jgi:hypothetical protein